MTRFADQAVMQTWARLERADREAPSLKRDWTLDVPSKVAGEAGQPAAYDVDTFFREAESALQAIEAAGHERFTIGLWVDDPSIERALRTLGSLGCSFGLSNEPPEGQIARIIPGAGVGGVVGGDLLAWAVEQEACKDDNREKLREPLGARRRHLFVLVDGSAGTAFSAATHGLTGRLPELCEPITTAWVAGGGDRLFVTTPPGGWQEHAIPEEVFADPDRWLDPDP